MRGRGGKWRRQARRTGRSPGRIARVGAVAGLTAYGAMRLGAPVFRRLARVSHLNALAEGAGQLSRHADALAWGLGSGLVAAGNQGYLEGRKRWRRPRRR